MTKEEKVIFQAHIKKDILSYIINFFMFIGGVFLAGNYFALNKKFLCGCWFLISLSYLLMLIRGIRNAYKETKNIMVDKELLK